MPSNKYQRKKAATQAQINTPTDKSKKSQNITRIPATPLLTLTATTLIISDTFKKLFLALTLWPLFMDGVQLPQG